MHLGTGMRIMSVMERTETLRLAVTPDMAAELRGAAATEGFGTIDDVVNQALEEWRARRIGCEYTDEELQRLAQEGIDSGPGIDGDEAFAALRAEFAVPGRA